MKTDPEQTARPAVAVVGAGSASLSMELAAPNGMLRRVLTQQVSRLRNLAAQMEEEGKCLKILGTTEKRIPHSFSRGAEMCGAADMAREWAANLESLLPKSVVSLTGTLPDSKIPNQVTSPGVGL